MLVELRIFKKVKFGFLLVGHMNDHINQMLRHFEWTPRRKKVRSRPSLIEIIRKTYHLEPIVHKLEENVDMQRFIFGSHGEERCI